MNLNIWFDIPSKYIDDFCVVVSVAVGISWQRLTDTSSQNFKLLFFFEMWQMWQKCDKCLLKSLFFQTWHATFFSFCICAIGFRFKTESCSLCSEFLTGLCYAQKLHFDAFPIPLNSFSDRTRCDFVLLMHANTGIRPNQK